MLDADQLDNPDTGAPATAPSGTPTPSMPRPGIAGEESPGEDSASLQRLFPECFEILFPAVLDAIPQIITALGRGSNRETAVAAEEENERFLPLLITSIVPILTQVVPVLIDQIQGATRNQPAAETDGTNNNSTNRGIEQMLPNILGGIVPEVVFSLPSILESLFGARNVPALRDGSDRALPDVVIDTEVTNRFFGPVLNMLATGIASTLPQLIATINGSARPSTSRDIPVSWSDFVNTNRLWDGDMIIGRQIPIENQDVVEIALEIAPHLSWWKGIQVLDDSGTVVAELEVENDAKVATAAVDPRTIERGGSLLFRKAKAFGIRTGMYRLPTAQLPLRGQRTLFYWAAN